MQQLLIEYNSGNCCYAYVLLITENVVTPRWYNVGNDLDTRITCLEVVWNSTKSNQPFALEHSFIICKEIKFFNIYSIFHGEQR